MKRSMRIGKRKMYLKDQITFWPLDTEPTILLSYSESLHRGVSGDLRNISGLISVSGFISGGLVLSLGAVYDDDLAAAALDSLDGIEQAEIGVEIGVRVGICRVGIGAA